MKMLRQLFPAATGPTGKAKLPQYLTPQCGACGLWRKCVSPKMPVDGRGERKILIIGEGPGEFEDERGQPFVGKTGQLLERFLSRAGVNMRKDCWLTNSVICRPWERKEGRKANRAPTPVEVAYCQPNLLGTIRELNPEVIIPLGGSAVHSLIGWLWKESPGAVGRWVGWKIPSQRLNAWVCPAWHPSYVSREEENPLVQELFLKHLKAAVSLQGRPWDPTPNWGADVKLELYPSQAAQYLGAIIRMGKRVAIDLETTCLKPESNEAEIVSCAVSNGTVTVAYPWVGRAKELTQELIRSDLPVVGYNVKFEERWFRKEFGHGVRNWDFDGMLAAHTLDNRPGVCSCKFQGFVRLGVEPWEGPVAPYLKSDGPGRKNRIRELDLRTLLRYNALDALYELKLSRIMKEEMGRLCEDTEQVA